MKQIALRSVVALVAMLASSGAYALSNRTFVSGNGSDTNPCSLTAPCRSFAQAITQTNAGGEIAVLDTAGYGIVTINKAVSIINQDGVEAGITTASATDGITIGAGAFDVVNLRGLTLVGGGIGTHGITFTSGGTLNIQNCSIRGFTSQGVNFVPTASSKLNVSDTIVSNNGFEGILVQPTGNGVANTAFFERVQSIGNGTGFSVTGQSATGGTLAATANTSAASGNIGGFAVISLGGGAVTTFAVINSAAIGNGTGLSSTNAGATMFIAGSTVSGNATHGFNIQTSGLIKTFGNNNITDTNNVGTLTPAGQQ
jgi:hypothetical protein